MSRKKKEGRLHVRLETDLKCRVEEHVAKHSTTFTELVTRLLVTHLDAEDAAIFPEAEQL